MAAFNLLQGRARIGSWGRDPSSRDCRWSSCPSPISARRRLANPGALAHVCGCYAGSMFAESIYPHAVHIRKSLYHPGGSMVPKELTAVFTDLGAYELASSCPGRTNMQLPPKPRVTLQVASYLERISQHSTRHGPPNCLSYILG